MRPTQEVLFGAFPRRVGTPAQHWVFNEAQFDLFTDTVEGSRNSYATVGVLPLTEAGDAVSDKVLFDLDGDKSAFTDDAADDRRVAQMRADPTMAAEVLAEVCEDAQRLARESRDDGIPVVGVFSGFGIHVHQLYQPTTDPSVAMTTVAKRYIEKADLGTADWAVVGQPERICRVPNMPRMTHRTGRRDRIRDGTFTGLYTVPLTHDELVDVTPEWLLDVSQQPRELAADALSDQTRSQMPVWEEFRGDANEHADAPQRPVDTRTAPIESDADIEGLLEELISMPCMVQRLMQPNPEHEVRLNGAVLMFNCGLKPQHVLNIYSAIGWVDFSRETTRKHLRSIYRNGYSDMTCQTLRSKGLCVRADDPSDCPTYGWSDTDCGWT